MSESESVSVSVSVSVSDAESGSESESESESDADSTWSSRRQITHPIHESASVPIAVLAGLTTVDATMLVWVPPAGITSSGASRM